MQNLVVASFRRILLRVIRGNDGHELKPGARDAALRRHVYCVTLDWNGPSVALQWSLARSTEKATGAKVPCSKASVSC
jgi:hypothetical protein